MTVEQMRDLISKVYDTDSWRRKVAKMYESQVIAVYLKFVKDGKIRTV